MYHWCFILIVYCSSWHFQEKDHSCVIGQTVASLSCQSPSWWSICKGTTARNGTCAVCAAKNMQTSTTSGLILGTYLMSFPSSLLSSSSLFSSGVWLVYASPGQRGCCSLNCDKEELPLPPLCVLFMLVKSNSVNCLQNMLNLTINSVHLV